MKVADMFASLRVQPDTGSFRAADRMIGGLRDSLGGVMGMAAAVFGAGQVARDVLNFDDALTSLDIGAAGALGSIKDFRNQILGVSDDTGATKEELLAASNAFIALTGDGEAAKESLATFGKVNIATKASMDDIAASAAAINQNLGVMPSQFEQAFSTLVAQGKAGAVELKDLAVLLAPLTPMAAQFAGGTGLEGLSKLSAALQIARRGFGSAKQTGTGLEALMGAIQSKAGSFTGIKIFEEGADGVKRLRAMDTIIQDISDSDLAKDPEKLIKAFGSKEAYAAYLQLSQNKEAWDDLAKSTMHANDIQKDYEKRQRSLSATVRKFWNQVKNAITRAALVIADNLKLAAIAVGSLLAAMLLLGAGGVGAALATGLAWAAALIPIILLGALIAAVILFFEDLYRAMTGGDSALATMWDDGIDEAKRKLAEFFNWVKDKVDQSANWIADLADEVTGGKASDWGNEMIQGNFLGNRLLSAPGLKPSGLGFSDQGNAAVFAGQGNAAMMAAAGMPSLKTGQGRRDSTGAIANGAAGKGGPTVNIIVQGAGATAEQIGDIVLKKQTEFFAEQARILEDAMGGGQ